jgi:hypothetical protein
VKHPCHPGLLLACTLGVHSLCACEPKLIVGERTCVAASADPRFEPVGVPWSTGFEDGFCDYTRVAGYCYADGDASYTVVSSPAHSGNSAAAFQIRGDSTLNPGQARCVRRGEFPTEAYYSAWYFLPTNATNSGNWNLFHFQGGEPGDRHGLWDVSLSSAANGDLSLYVYDFLTPAKRGLGETPPIPIGAWFQIEFYLRRAADATGELALYQDGERIFELTNVRTDDTTWGQWYVGNLATDLAPPNSTLYVDDVAIRATR